MARLTRTAKFADLREQLANDKEESIATQDLSSYQNRLDNVQDTLSFNPKKEEPEYTWTPFNNDTFSQPVEPINPWKEEIKSEPVVEQTPIQEPVAEPVQETKQESSYFDSFMNSNIEETKENNDFSSYFENKEIQTSEVFDDVKDDSGEIVSLKERETYLNQTFSDVNSYNINNGQQTIDQLLDSSVEEVRHPENVQVQPVEEPIDNTQVWTSFKEEEVLDTDKLDQMNAFAEEKIDDEEFSNTVSMEISKIMDEIAAMPVEESKPEIVEEEIKVEEPVKEEINETIEINEEVIEEKPEDVVEIKNISEIEAEPVKDTMSSTIPFVVAAEDEEILDEDDEEDGSNTILNVILIVLIVVLVAVLGLIVFYILKTKGIF